MRALVIDDSRATREIIGKILIEIGFEIVEAGNGAEGLQRLQESQHVDLALVDWNMPVMNGLDFVKNVRALPQFNDINLMMVTTESAMEQVGEALQAGANEYVMKPFTKEMIIEKMSVMGMSVDG